jgi:hypothetical protein
MIHKTVPKRGGTVLEEALDLSSDRLLIEGMSEIYS